MREHRKTKQLDGHIFQIFFHVPLINNPTEVLLFRLGFSVFQHCATVAFHLILYSMRIRSKVLEASGNTGWFSVRDCSYFRALKVIVVYVVHIDL